MLKKFSRNSKKGLTLPMAIVISIVLVIVAAGLVFIALSSISTTDVAVNGRQAFMDVRSALDYTESYYRTQISNYSKIGKQMTDTATNKKWREEYIVAEEDEVAVEGVKRTTVKYSVQNTYPDTEKIKTYVVAQYFPASGKTPPRLKLTGYSHYSDTFGNKGKMVSLSVQFDVGSSGSQKRVTVINTWKDPNTQSTTDTITLHLKKPADLDWANICYYVWTYNDVAGAYKDSNGKNVKYSYYKNDGTKFTPDVDKINIDEKTESVKPNSAWNIDPDSKIHGPSGMLVSQGNGWSVGDYQINSKRVNYFNVIFNNQDTLLSDLYKGDTKVRDGNGIFDSQLNEIFHLWYLNEDDKNIYFEFLNKKKYDEHAGLYYYTRYRTGMDWKNSGALNAPDGNSDSWDGMQGLDDTILVYLRNQKTTVHFRSWQDSNSMTAGEAKNFAAPVMSIALSDGSTFKGPTFLTNDGKEMKDVNNSDINKECSGSKKTTNIVMQYEGCGWWVANIETKKSFNATITYNGITQTLNGIRPHRETSAPEEIPESWIVLKSSGSFSGGAESGKLEAHQTEKNALRSLGVDLGSYVTIHAKNYDADLKASPVLRYVEGLAESSVGRQNLYEKILEMNMLVPGDYSNYSSLFDDNGTTKGLRNKAIDVYNKGVNFMKAPYGVDDDEITPDPDASINVSLAEAAYATYVERISNCIASLMPAAADSKTITDFNNIYNTAKEIYGNLVDYDSGYHDQFKSAYEKTFSEKPYTSYQDLYEKLQDKEQVTINKSDLVEEYTNLKNAVEAIDENKLPSRTKIERLVKEVDDSNYIDDSIYEKEQVDDLRTKLASARELIEKNGDGTYKKATTITNFNTVYNNLVGAIEEVKNHVIPKNEFDFTGLDSKIADANQTISNAEASGENYTDASKQALEQAVAQASELRGSTTTSQEAINAAADNVQKYIDRFAVYKPENINDSIKAEGKVRIWLENQDGCTFSVFVKGSTGDFVQLDNQSRICYEAGTQLSYVDLVKTTELEFRVTVRIGDDPENQISAEDVVVADMTDDTVIYSVDKEARTITPKDLVTVFLGRKDADKKSISVDAFSSVQHTTKGYGSETNYLFIRFAVDKNTSFNDILHINRTESSLGAGALTGDNIIKSAGEYVIIWTDNMSEQPQWRGYKTIKVSDIYPKPAPETKDEEPDTPPVGGTVAPASEDYEIRSLATNLDWAAAFEDIRTKTSSGDKKIVLFDTQNWSEFSGKQPYIYAWKGAGDSDDTRNAKYDNKPAMTKYQDTYYYYVCDAKYENIIITNGSGNDGGSIKKIIDTTYLSNDKLYYVIRTNGSQVGKTGKMVWSGLPEEVHSGETPDSTDLNWSVAFEDIKNQTSSGDKKIILFDTQNWSEFSGKKPYIYAWTGAGKSNDTRNDSYNNKPGMVHYSSTYYYYVCENKFDNIIITNGSGDDGGVIKKIIDTTALPKNNKYIVVRTAVNETGKAGKIVWSSNTIGASTIGGNTISELLDIVPNTGMTCVMFDTQNSGKTPYIHYWNGTDESPDVTYTQMVKYKENYYYIEIGDENTNFKISYDSAGTQLVVPNSGELALNASGGRYKYYIVRPTASNTYSIEHHDVTPSINISSSDPVDMSDAHQLEMAYVGGGRVRVKNKSYVETYGEGKKWNSMAGQSKYNGGDGLDIDPHYIIVYKDGDGTDYETKSPRIYVWKASSGNSTTSWDDRPEMTYLGQSGSKFYFYYVCDRSFNMCKVTTVNNVAHYYQTGDITLGNKNYYIINGVGGNVDSESNELSSLPSELRSNLPSSGSGSSTSDVENKVEATLTGADDKKTISDDWKFGGYGGNNSSNNRVGDSKLLPYYDWYEYKIPVSSFNMYNFEVWGLDPKDTSKQNKTPQIQDVYGDVWVSLYNDDTIQTNDKALDGTTKSIKTFKYTELSTFDPEKNMTTEKVTVYFKMPVKAGYKYQNPRLIKAYGTGDKDTEYMQQDIPMTPVAGGNDPTKSGYGRNLNIYKVDGISKNNPFLELAVDCVLESTGEALPTRKYKIKMQGGRKVLFNPNRGLDGEWEKYTSDYDYLEDVCDTLLNMYYAKTIINQYNSQGEIVHQSNETKTQAFSSYLLSIIQNYTEYFRAAGYENGGTYKTNINRSNIEANDTAADNAYNDYIYLKDVVETYTTLYTKMTSESRTYMNIPLSLNYNANEYHTNDSNTSQYPEFINRGNYKIYNQEDVDALAKKVSNAEKTYITGEYTGATKGLDAAQKAIEAIDRAIANMRVGVEGTIAVVLYDAQSKLDRGYSFTVSYKDNLGVEHKNEPVDQVNIEGYPIKFIYNEITEQPYDYITDVQFSNSYTDKTTGGVNKNVNIGPSLAKIEKNEVYVLMDYEKVDDEEAAFWRKNDLTDYRQMDSDEYIKEGDDDEVILKMKKETADSKYETMTVYFRYDTKVKYGTTEYTIKAGSYDFKDEDTTKATSPVYGGELKLFSDNAMSYFINPDNYGVYPDMYEGFRGVSAQSLGWTNGTTFSTAHHVSTTDINVNLDVSSGSFTSLPLTRSYSYSAKGGIYFRWSSESALQVGGGGVELHASEIRFGSVGVIDASQYGTNYTHFKLYSFSGEDSMVVNFLTDVTVRYPTNTGLTRSFVIREGKYLIRKVLRSELEGGNPDDEGYATDYIADLFDETYWKDGIHAKPLNDGEDTSVSGGGSSGLSEKPTYSN